MSWGEVKLLIGAGIVETFAPTKSLVVLGYPVGWSCPPLPTVCSRPCWPRIVPGGAPGASCPRPGQVLLVLAHLRDNATYAALVAAFGAGVATVFGYVSKALRGARGEGAHPRPMPSST